MMICAGAASAIQRIDKAESGASEDSVHAETLLNDPRRSGEGWCKKWERDKS